MINSVYCTQGNTMGVTNNICWLDAPNKQYSNSLTLNPFFNTDSFYSAVNYSPQTTNVFDEFQTYSKPVKSKRKTHINKNKKIRKAQPQQTVQPQQLQAQAQPQPSRWKRICNWFADKYEQFNNFIEQPFTTTKNWFMGTPQPTNKISLTSATTQSLGNIGLKIIAMPILAPLAIAGLMYTSIKPLVQYCKQV